MSTTNRRTRRAVTGGLALLATVAIVSLLPGKADAHGKRPRISVGFSYGYPVYYGPYGYYGRYYGPGSHIGVRVWQRPRHRRIRQRDAGEVRSQALYVYPAAGQSEQKMADDRYDCHVWSVDATGFDPTLGAGSREEANDYARAFTACMEGRDYVVR